MSTVAITITVPGGSPVDYTNSCIFSHCSFTQNMNAVPGNFEIWLRDPSQTLSFTTGSEIMLTVDGLTLFGGFVTQLGETNMFEAVDTNPPSEVETRVHILRGADYNIIFDRRVWRDTGDYFHFIDLSADTSDGQILRDLVDNFADLSDFSSAGIVDCADIDGDVVQQGEVLRKEFQSMSDFGGTVWYIAPDKTFVYRPYESVEKRWGFSDAPNNQTITVSPDQYQGSTIGYRSVEATEDGSYMANDVLIWGGSKFAGSGGTVFARAQDATSIADHNRWQHGETHFGERGYRIQAGVDARASAILNGPPGTAPDPFVGTNVTKGLKYPQWQVRFTWFSVDVPLLSGTPDHLVPGDIVTILLETFSETQFLPLRTIQTSFPNAFVSDGSNLVQFQGTFGLQLSDPFTLWRYLLTNQGRVEQTTITSVDSTSTSTVYGAQFADEPSPVPNGATTVFTIPFGYIVGTSQMYLFVSGGDGGLLLTRGSDYTESDPVAGEFTFPSPVATGDTLWVICSTLDS